MRKPRLIFPVMIWAAIVVLLLCLPLLGCASKPLPICEKFGAYSANTSDGPVMVIDMANAEKLVRMMTDLNDGKCRLERPGET